MNQSAIVWRYARKRGFIRTNCRNHSSVVLLLAKGALALWDLSMSEAQTMPPLAGRERTEK